MKGEIERPVARPSQAAPAGYAPAAFADGPYRDEVDLRDYALKLKEWWRTIALATLASMVATWVVASFLMTKWYRATAIIHPVAPSGTESRLAGLLGSIGGGLAASSGLLINPSANPAEEYMPILKSYAFATAVVGKHKLAAHLLAQEKRGLLSRLLPEGRQPRDLSWHIFRIMKDRFDCEFSRLTGNMTLHYFDPDRQAAQRILDDYVGDLREKLRSQQAQDAAQAVRSLTEQVTLTADVVLQAQLYELIARQIQREKLAEVQADFAFTVLSPPTVPDRPYKPRPLFDAVLAGMLTSFLLVFGILAFGAPARVAPGEPARLGAAPDGRFSGHVEAPEEPAGEPHHPAAAR